MVARLSRHGTAGPASGHKTLAWQPLCRVRRQALALPARARSLHCRCHDTDGCRARPRREPVDALRAYLAGYVDRTSGANGRRGCLLVATAMELAGQDAEVGRRIAGFFRAMEARVADALFRAKLAGKLADGVDPASAAKILVCFVEGLRVVGKTAPARATSQATADALLDRFVR
ncbi:TetR family transcriptional regulator C-terminal domain-containing protein [Bradyrhizobium japonicum]|uniref:TetR family transcriptional regulator C-terminal domain-containing protein n=1 Tax=Bradyrhizobium japonicum TaxID=375 RepID=UPI003F88490A